MSAKQGRIVVMWGHLALLAVIVGVILFYLLSARRVSLQPTNLLLIQPAAIFALVMAALVVPQCFRRLPAGQAPEKESLNDLGRVLLLMTVFAAFALTMEHVGFDVATFVFMVVALAICGERKWLLNIGFSAVFTVLLIYGYGAIIPFPFPLTVL